jgi:tetratricopeptide (TPR) repeat protein
MRHALLLAALWTMTLLAYSNSFTAALIFDSNRVVLQDTRIRAVTPENRHLIWTEDYWYPTLAGGLFRPLTTLSYQWNYAVLGNGPHPAGYHWINLLLHLVNIGLVYLVGLLIFEAPWPAFALAALWALHPLLTESVTNVVGRADLLAAFGVLAGLLCYTRGVAASGWRRAAWLAAAAASSAVGIFSKESAIVVLAVAPIYDLAFGRAITWRSRLPGYAALSLPVLVYLQMRSHVLANLPSLVTSFGDNPLVGAGFWTARFTAVKVIGKYLWLLVWPAHLSADYSYNQVPLFRWRFDNLEDGKTLFALAMCIAAAAAAVAAWRRAKPVFFFIAFFFAALSPTANLVIPIGTIMAERFLYLPSIGFAGCLVWLMVEARGRWPAMRMAAPAALAVVSLALAARTFARNSDWHDEQSLWASSAKACPGSYKTHTDLALASMSLPNGTGLDIAQTELERALAILGPLPDHWNPTSAWATAGFFYRLKGDMLAQSQGSNPGYDPHSNPWYRKSLEIFLRGRRIDEAWNRAMKQRNLRDGKPIADFGWPPLYLGLGRLYERLQEPQQALEAFQYGLAIRVQPEFFEEIYATWRALGDPEQAVKALMEGLAADPTQAQLASRIVLFYRETAPMSCALTSAGGSVSLNLGCPLVHDNLCGASQHLVERYRRSGHTAEANASIASAVRTLDCPAGIFK